MAYGDRPVGMDHPGHWLAILRIVVGLWFAKAVITKLGVVMLGGVVPVPGASARWVAVMPKLVAKQAAENPVLWYRDFLQHTVITHAPVFAQLTAWGETLAGIGLTLGLLTGAASCIALFLVINYGLATQWMSSGNQGFHLMLFAMIVTFFFARAGRTWGLDALIARNRPRSIWARRPLS